MGEIIREHRYPLIARYVIIARRHLTPLFRQTLHGAAKTRQTFVQDDLLKSVAPIRRELDRVGASSHATNAMLKIIW